VSDIQGSMEVCSSYWLTVFHRPWIELVWYGMV
jgi:hypothetical protein